MSGDRETPYVFGERIGPDIAAIVAKHPHDCTVHYKGNWYKFMTCCRPECKRQYWRRYGDSTHGPRAASSSNPTRTYCSDECAQQRRQALKAARQARWQAKTGRSRKGR